MNQQRYNSTCFLLTNQGLIIHAFVAFVFQTQRINGQVKEWRSKELISLCFGKLFCSAEVQLQRQSTVGKLFTCDVSQHVAVNGKQLEEGCYYPPKEPIKELVHAPVCWGSESGHTMVTKFTAPCQLHLSHVLKSCSRQAWILYDDVSK